MCLHCVVLAGPEQADDNKRDKRKTMSSHLCCSMHKNVFRVSDRKHRQFIIYCLGYFVNLTTMVEVRDLFHQLCTVFGSSSVDTTVDTTVEEVMRNIKLKVKTTDAAKYEEADDQDPLMTSGLSVSIRSSEFYIDCLKNTVQNTSPIRHPQKIIITLGNV